MGGGCAGAITAGLPTRGQSRPPCATNAESIERHGTLPPMLCILKLAHRVSYLLDSLFKVKMMPTDKRDFRGRK